MTRRNVITTILAAPAAIAAATLTPLRQLKAAVPVTLVPVGLRETRERLEKIFRSGDRRAIDLVNIEVKSISERLIPPPAPSPDIVRQIEIQEVLDLHNQAEILAAYVRRRLEAGTDFESGKFGVSTWGQESLEWYEENGGIGTSAAANVVGLEINSPEYHRQFLEKHRQLAAKIWA